MSPNNDVWLLKRTDIFELLPTSVLQRLAALVDVQAYRKGDKVYRQHEPSYTLYILKKGRVKLFVSSGAGRELVLNVLESGALFGEEALGGDEPRRIGAEALTESWIGRLRVSDAAPILKDHPETLIKLSRVMCRRLAEAHDLMASLVFKSIQGRLAGLLIKLADDHGQPREGHILLDYRITHQEIAGRIGSTRETVTATLNDFRRRGLLDSNGRKLLITDVPALRQIHSSR